MRISSLFCCFLLCFSLGNRLQAQLQFNIVNGINFSNNAPLNELLENNGYEALPMLNRHVGGEFGFDLNEILLRFEYNVLYQRRSFERRLGDRNSTLTGGYANFMCGLKIINRTNSAFIAFTGASIALPMRLRLINGNLNNNTFLGQIQNPSIQVTEFDYYSTFYLPIGIEYSTMIKKAYRFGLRASYSARISRAEWLSDGKILSGDIPKINPIGGQVSIFFGF